jgi:hypothetical protein
MAGPIETDPPMLSDDERPGLEFQTSRTGSNFDVLQDDDEQSNNGWESNSELGSSAENMCNNVGSDNIAPWLQGLSASTILQEEFEVEVSSQGTSLTLILLFLSLLVKPRVLFV